MDIEKGNSSLLSKACCCHSLYKKIRDWFSEDYRGESILLYFGLLVGAFDFVSDIYVMLIYYRKDYFLFWICSVISLLSPSFVTASFFVISCSDGDDWDCSPMSAGGSIIQLLSLWLFYLVLPIIGPITPILLCCSREYREGGFSFLGILSLNFNFICLFLESIAQSTINALFLYHEKELSLPNVISLCFSATMIIWGIIRGCLGWKEFNFRDIKANLDYENDGS